MRVVVVGATGTLGPHVVRLLLDRGHDVVGTTTTAGKRQQLEQMGVEAVVVDVLEREQTAAALAKTRPDAVVNLATRLPAAGPRRIRDMTATNRLRREGTSNLLAGALPADVRRYVSESMVFVYGYGRQREPAAESQPPARGQSAGLQEVTDALAEGESLVAEATAAGHLEGVSLRFGLFHSPEAVTTQEMARLVGDRRFPLIGGGEAVHSWIALEDAATAVALAVESESPSDVYNVVDDLPVRLAEYVTEISRLLDAKSPRSVPSWIVRPFASYTTTFLADVQLPVSNALLKRELDWRPSLPTYREALAPLGVAGDQSRA